MVTGSGEAALVPVTEFAPAELAPRLVELVAANKSLLTARYILGPLSRYTSEQTAEAAVVGAHQLHRAGTQEIFVVRGESGDPEGIATVYPRLELKRLRLPIPLGVPDQRLIKWLRRHFQLADKAAQLRWWVSLPFATPNLTAWTGTQEEALLARAYQELDARVGSSADGASERPWTIEPRRSPSYVHEAIGMTSLALIAKHRLFDDQESRAAVPPLSTLYARLRGEWWTAHGRQRELRTGQKSWLDDINEKMAARAAQLKASREQSS